MCTSSVSNVIYHKFSHGAAFYTLNGKNVNVMLEYCFYFQGRLLTALKNEFSTLAVKLKRLYYRRRNRERNELLQQR